MHVFIRTLSATISGFVAIENDRTPLISGNAIVLDPHDYRNYYTLALNLQELTFCIVTNRKYRYYTKG